MKPTPPPMKPTPRAVPGPFIVHELGDEQWQLTAGTTQLFVAFEGPGAERPILRSGRVGHVTLEWRDDGVGIAFDHGAERFAAKSAFLHEAGAGIYRELPLAAFDAGARRFWWRIFGVMRLPGGGRLVRWLSRRR